MQHLHPCMSDKRRTRGLTPSGGRPYRALRMKILIIGGGAREHAIAWKLRHSPQIEHLWCVPGNAGLAQLADCSQGNLSDVTQLADAAQRMKPDLTIVGPEQPLVLGVADEFEHRRLRVLGPSRAASQLEGSKVFAKEFMARHGIPTAPAYGMFDNAVDAYTSLCEVDWPVVVKADGLCAGKGVLVTSSPDEASAFIERLMERNEFGEAGKHVIIEEGLVGREISYIVLTDGDAFLPLAPARDYKRAFDGDLGPNTGGMGAISTNSLLPRGLENEIQGRIVRPMMEGMAKEGHEYKGFLYIGLMITKDGPKVLEFNCRLGDPETETLAMRMNFDFAAACDAAVSRKLANFQTDWSPTASACVVLASQGYPGKSLTGQVIEGLNGSEERRDVAVFHAGTESKDSKYYVRSGRVLTVAAGADTLSKARSLAYEAAQKISFEGKYCRKDIGADAESAAGS
jgi:phosphoribosylamine---glycine ligase